MKFKLTKQEKHWILYDVGNSAFILLSSTILPLYFNYLANLAGISDTDYLAFWGYAVSLSTLTIFILGPILGSLADTKGYKKPLFMTFLFMGVIACMGLGMAVHWLFFLGIFVIAKIGFSGSLIFYDSMMSDITTEERMDDVSSQGYAWGYIGSCIPFIVCLALVLGHGAIGLSMEIAIDRKSVV